jgi:excisionase family DNA binding protein
LKPAFYTLNEVAELLKISKSTARRAIKSGALTSTRVGSLGQIRVSGTALDEYLRKGSNEGPSAHYESISAYDVLDLAEPKDEVTYVRGTGEVHRAHDTKARIDPVSARATPRSDAHGVRKLEGKTSSGMPWVVLNGQVSDALVHVPTASVDCVVTSPPYYWQRDYEVDGQIGHESTIEGYVGAIVDAFRGVQRVLSDDGTLFLNLGDTYYSAKGKPHGRDDKHSGRQMMRRHLRAVDGPGLGLPRKSLIGIPWRVAIAMQTDGWTLRSSVIWERPASLPEPTARDRPWRSYEHVFIFSKGPRYYFNRKGLGGEEDVWRMVARPENPGAHFAPYPRELVDRCLDVGCKPGGIVLDPFVGSGTTMLCALKRKSPAYGIDLKAEYCDFIAKRLGGAGGEQSRRRQPRVVNA